MENEINKRIEILIDKLSKNQSDFASKIGRSSQTISNIVNKGSKPGSEVLEAILKTFPQIDALWLVCGIGEMQKSLTMSQDSSSQIIEVLKRENEILLRNNEELLKNQDRLWNLIESTGKKDNPTPEGTNVIKVDFLQKDEQLLA